MNDNNKTFAKLAESVLFMVLYVYVGGQSGRVDVVFDVYRQPSLKDCERQNQVQALPFSTNAWRKFLCSSFKKKSLIKILVGEWKLQRFRDVLQGKALFVTCEDTCFKMTADEWVKVAELQSTQEDTGLILHALQAARTGSKTVIVTAEDTDVMLPCLAFQEDIPCPMYEKYGTLNRTRFVDISKPGQVIGRQYL